MNSGGDITRRQVLFAAGGAAISASAAGCNVVIPATMTAIQIIVRLPWARILGVVSTVLVIADRLLRVVVRLEGHDEKLNAALDDKQVKGLEDGGKLILESKNGERFEVPYSIDRS